MKYHRLNDSEFSKKNKSFTYYEEHEIDRKFQEKLTKEKTKFLNMVLDNFEEKEGLETRRKENLKEVNSSMNISNAKKKRANFISEYSLFYKNDYLKSLFYTK